MKHIVKTPFLGYAETCITDDGKVLYSDMSADEYLAQDPALRVVTDEEFDALLSEHADSLVTEPKPESLEDWQYALEVLPPCRWQTYAGIEFFHISERLTGNLVAWHARIGAKCWTFTDYASRPFGELAEKVANRGT